MASANGVPTLMGLGYGKEGNYMADGGKMLYFGCILLMGGETRIFMSSETHFVQ